MAIFDFGTIYPREQEAVLVSFQKIQNPHRVVLQTIMQAIL